jgi:16S rRNA (uracil1498-N3)-methyltransferase
MGGDPHPFYAPPEAFDSEGWITLPEEEIRHATQVLRLGAGDRCRVIDGLGSLYHVRLERRGRDLAGMILDVTKEARRSCAVELGFPLLRLRARTEWMLEKAVEVGVARLLPIAWSRTVKDGSSLPRARWERIVCEALKQCERRWLPELAMIEGPQESLAGMHGDARLVLADPDGPETLPPYAGEARLRVLIGPEGGATPEEREAIVAWGGFLWSLGPARLRAETAAVAAVHRIDVHLRAAGV